MSENIIDSASYYQSVMQKSIENRKKQEQENLDLTIRAINATFYQLIHKLAMVAAQNCTNVATVNFVLTPSVLARIYSGYQEDQFILSLDIVKTVFEDISSKFNGQNDTLKVGQLNKLESDRSSVEVEFEISF